MKGYIMIRIKLKCPKCGMEETTQYTETRARKIIKRYDKGYEEPYCELCETSMKWTIYRSKTISGILRESLQLMS